MNLLYKTLKRYSILIFFVYPYALKDLRESDQLQFLNHLKEGNGTLVETYNQRTGERKTYPFYKLKRIPKLYNFSFFEVNGQ